MSRRILIFSTNYLPNIGGAEIAIEEITDRISPGEIAFDMITPRYTRTVPSVEHIGNITVYRVGFGWGVIDKILSPFLAATKVLLGGWWTYDAYWCMMASFTSGGGYILNILRFWKRVPIILTLQEGDSEEHIRRRWLGMTHRAWKAALRRTHVLTVISTYLKLRSHIYGYRGNVQVIPNGVDIRKFEYADENAIKHIQKTLNKKDGEVWLINVSRLVVKNAVDDCVRALALLPDHVKLVVIGEGSEKKKIQSLIRDVSLEDRVLLLGSLPNKEIPAYLHASDIFIRPSLSEGQGISFIEAMAARLPVLATPVGGIIDFIKHEKTGLMCQVKNPRSIAESVNRLLSDTNLRDHIVDQAYTLVKSKYEWDHIVPAMKDVFITTCTQTYE